jgi:spore maturation protein CgeB
MIDSICLLTHPSLYSACHHFAQHLAKSLKKQGITATEIAIHDPSNIPISKIKSLKPSLTCSFNSRIALTPESSTYLCDEIGIPHWCILLDPPFSIIEMTKSPLTFFSSIDRDDTKVITDTYGFEDTFFFPHAIEADFCPVSDNKRIYDITFTGSCYDYEALRPYWQKHLPSSHCVIIEEAIARLTLSTSLSPIRILIELWQSHRMLQQSDFTSAEFRTVFFFIDYYIRGWDRVQLLRSVAQRHPVHIWGSTVGTHIRGWEHYLEGYEQAYIHPAVDFQQVHTIMQQSKICLNSTPCFRHGSHERILASFLAGAVPVTSDSSWVRDEFNPNESLFIYTTPQRDTIIENILMLLKDEDRRQAMVTKGRDLVLSRHTWDKRTEKLTKTLDTILSK